MSRDPEPIEPLEPLEPGVWEPATSRPGEIFTVEGQIRSYGAAARNLTNRDPRYVAHRRSMMRTGLAVLGAGLVVVAVLIAATAMV